MNPGDGWFLVMSDKMAAWKTVSDSVAFLKDRLLASELNDEQAAVFNKAVSKLHDSAYNIVRTVEALNELLNCVKHGKMLSPGAAGLLGTSRSVSGGLST